MPVLLAEAMDKVGRDGVITIEESKTLIDELEVVEGVRVDRGYISPHFVTDAQRMEVALDEPLFLLTDQKLSSPNDIVAIMEKVIEGGRRPLVIIAEDVDGEALATLVVNKIRGNLNCVAIKAPGFGERRKALSGGHGNCDRGHRHHRRCRPAFGCHRIEPSWGPPAASWY